MARIEPRKQDSFVYSCSSADKWGNEQFVSDHVLSFQLSGETHIFHQKGTFVFGKNQVLLTHRNQFARTLKMPCADREYKAVSIILKSEYLKKYAANNGIEQNQRYTGNYNVVLEPNSFLKSYCHSLLPYLQSPEGVNYKMVVSKITELLELLLHSYPDLRCFLFDFTEPHKIDIEEFMLKNFRYNSSVTGSALVNDTNFLSVISCGNFCSKLSI
ncbi:hypothetical protein [Sphingobacterium sp. HMA12]|uniref:hypothetical protein n=1 Tax=Sphingobacterium sp. HMA12 TaxID=2050894 RepID=UPI0018F858D0